MVSDAEVWRMNSVTSPSGALMVPSQVATARVMSMKPRPGVSMVSRCCACRTTRGSSRCGAARQGHLARLGPSAQLVVLVFRLAGPSVDALARKPDGVNVQDRQRHQRQEPE